MNKETEKYNKFQCYECDGLGYTAEHDPLDPHEYGCSNCPIKMPCNICEGKGYIIQELLDKK